MRRQLSLLVLEYLYPILDIVPWSNASLTYSRLADVCISVPYQTGFDISVQSGSMTWWIEVVVDVYFFIDICLNFRTPFVDEQGRMVYTGKAMARNYIRGWFIIDVSSCASLLQYVFEIFDFGDGDAASKTRVAKVLRLLRMAKLLRVARLKRLVERMGDDLITILAPIGNIFVLLVGTAFAVRAYPAYCTCPLKLRVQSWCL